MTHVHISRLPLGLASYFVFDFLFEKIERDELCVVCVAVPSGSFSMR